jgi:hypothetical protein
MEDRNTHPGNDVLAKICDLLALLVSIGLLSLALNVVRI